MDEKITIEHDGRYWRVITFDDKSYVLYKYDEDVGEKDEPIKIKGGTLNSRSLENYCRGFLKRSIMYIFYEQYRKIRVEYDFLNKKIQMKAMTVDEIKKRQTLNISLEHYKNKLESGDPPLAQYEAALHSSRPYLKGDSIETWVEEPEPERKEYKTKEDKWIIPKKPSYEIIRPVDKFNGNIYRDHYYDRLEKTVKKFLTVLGYDYFVEMFPEIKLQKDDKAKLIPIMGLLTFLEKFPKFKFRSADYKKLNDEDKTKFQQMVKNGELKDEYRKFFETS